MRIQKKKKGISFHIILPTAHGLRHTQTSQNTAPHIPVQCVNDAAHCRIFETWMDYSQLWACAVNAISDSELCVRWVHGLDVLYTEVHFMITVKDSRQLDFIPPFSLSSITDELGLSSQKKKKASHQTPFLSPFPFSSNPQIPGFSIC